jgi:thiamine kinase-like enzyme
MRDQDLLYRLGKEWSAKTVRIKKAGGQTNYIVEHKGKKFFVRLPWENQVVDRNIEGENILALKKNKKLASILPAYYLYIVEKKNILTPKSRDVFDVPDGTMITEYIEGTEFSFKMFLNKRYQEMLANMLYAFHTSGVRFVNDYDVFRNEIAPYRVVAQKNDLSAVTDQKTISAFGKFEKEAKKKLRPVQKGVSTHNDFIFQNFLVGKHKKAYLLDFEYAGLNKRGGIYYDFGFLFADNLFRKPRMSKDIFEDFLAVADSVYGRILDREQIYAAASAVVIMQFWWGILRYSNVSSKKERQYFLRYTKKRARFFS